MGLETWELIMIELVLSVCFVADVHRCKDVHLTYVAETVSMHECMMYGQNEIAKWSEGNPNWRVQKWSCGSPRQVAKI